jgi:hypothetical protein
MLSGYNVKQTAALTTLSSLIFSPLLIILLALPQFISILLLAKSIAPALKSKLIVIVLVAMAWTWD